MSDLPWIKSYPEGVRWDAELPTMPVQQILRDAAARFGDKPALSFMGSTLGYRQFDRLVDQAARGLQALGVGPGVHVGLFLPNTLHYPISLFAVLRAGGTVVNYSPLDVEKVLAHKIEDSRTDLMITLDSPALLPQMQRLLDSTRLKTLVIGEPGDRFDGSGGPALADPRQQRFSQLLANDGAPQEHPLGDLRDALAVIQYTGGTTGLPKGAMLTHANLSSACAQYVASSQTVPPSIRFGEERLLVVLPLFHIYSLTVNLLLGVRCGAELVLHPRFDLDLLMKDLAERRISIFAGVPTMYMAIVNHPSAATADLRSLSFCGSGGAPLPAELAARFTQLTGCTIGEGWGMTETSPTGTFSPITGPRHLGSCGIPLPGILLKLVSLGDPSKDAARGEPGELCIKGPNVMKGYWNNPKATAESMTADGYFRSGDIATMDDDGFFSIVDRTKDMLLCGGYNVYPRIIEEALYEHPAVREACVIGIPDAYRGQSPKAFVSLKSGAAPFTLDELKRFLEDKIGKHEMVQALEIRAELPKTAVGKLSKRDLVEEEAARRASMTGAAENG